MKQFIPFHEIKGRNVIVVDGLHPQNLTLSHWKGANIHTAIAADSSGEIVLNAIEKNIKGIDNNLISATHFDIDGFVGVFALFYPEFALQFKKELTAMARIGDFREYKNNSLVDDFAVKLCIWMNTVEREQFYRPFEEKDEIQLCVEKFRYFLPMFKEVVLDIDKYKKDWITEYTVFKDGIQQLAEFESIEQHKNLGLFIRKTSSPIHYYALFSNTEGFDIVLSIYDNQRYELEYKYTTWVDIVSRPTLPRINLKALANHLNKLENSSKLNWKVDEISDTGPILRLESNRISKVDRYSNPYERRIYSSTIEEIRFKELIINYFNKHYQYITPKKFWSWNEIRHLNANLPT